MDSNQNPRPLLIYNNKTLGSGGFGRVYSSLLDEEVCACKVIVEEKKFIGINHPIEPIIMLHLRHECINFSRAMNCDNGVIYLPSIQAKCSLSDIRGKQFCENKYCLRIIHNLFRAIYFLHKHRLIHCDIKPANILYYEGSNIRLTDFSITRNSSWRCQGIRLGTKGYMAPEIYQQEKFSMSSDIWSLGITIFEMLTGEKFFAGEENTLSNVGELQNFVEKRLGRFVFKYGNFSKNTQKRLRKILSAMLTINPSERISIVELYFDHLFDNLGYLEHDHEEYHTSKAKIISNKVFNTGCDILRNEGFPQSEKIITLAQKIFYQVKTSLPNKLSGEKLNIYGKTILCLAIKLFHGTFSRGNYPRLESYFFSSYQAIEFQELEIIQKINLIPAIVDEL